MTDAGVVRPFELDVMILFKRVASVVNFRRLSIERSAQSLLEVLWFSRNDNNRGMFDGCIPHNSLPFTSSRFWISFYRRLHILQTCTRCGVKRVFVFDRPDYAARDMCKGMIEG